MTCASDSIPRLRWCFAENVGVIDQVDNPSSTIIVENISDAFSLLSDEKMTVILSPLSELVP